jgi:hypothetical protein
VLGERALDAALDPARFVAAADPVFERLLEGLGEPGTGAPINGAVR